MISRRTFLKTSVSALAGSSWVTALGSHLFASNGDSTVTILYTNDTHARIDPFPENSREYAGLGGIARRSSLVNKIRLEQENVLLLDAGDVFQGTRWFNVYGGEVDFKMMSDMGYDAMTIGNHEFDLGLDGFANAAQHAEFPFLCSNYATRNTPMDPFIERELIKEFDGFRIGIFGLGIQLDGVVDKDLQGDVRYRDPIRSARRSVDNFINFHQCDYIICLSHLGYRYDDNRIDDLELANSVPGIDLIIGGHTHTFLNEPAVVEHSNESNTLVTQMGHSGIRLGRIDLSLKNHSSQAEITHTFYTIGETS